MNRKGFELALSTLILIILGVVLLIGLIFVLTGGVTRFQGTTDPLLNGNELSGVREACRLACVQDDWNTYCCSNFTVSESTLTCSDERLGVSCGNLCARSTCLR